VVQKVRGDAESKETLPVVVGGDLNAVPDSDEISMLTGRRPGVPGVILSDVWEHVGPGGRFGADGITWRADNPHTANSTWPNRRLDYLLVSWPRKKPVGNPVRTWLAGTESVGGIHPSDHAAVVADLLTPGD
jgi:endonuclease/exonuclease/phosphatase family metal-dependent hydrolase